VNHRSSKENENFKGQRAGGKAGKDSKAKAMAICHPSRAGIQFLAGSIHRHFKN